MRTVHIPNRNIFNDEIKITDKGTIHHLRDVLRMDVGDDLAVFDERGNQYHCLIQSVSDEIVMKIEKKFTASPSGAAAKIIAACAIPKNSRFDDVVDKLTQLGVDKIVPLETERVIVNLDRDKKDLRRRRWQKIAISAAEQCQRPIVPVIDPVRSIKEVLAEFKDVELKFIPTLEGRRQSLRDILPQKEPASILYFIGPEGDFTAEEISCAKRSGCLPVSLGDTVLRVETAAVAVLGFIRFFYSR